MGNNKNKMGRWTKTIILVACFFLVYTVAGFFAAPAVLKSYLPKRLTKQLNREVTIGEIKLNPYALTLRISGFSVKRLDGDGDFISFDEFSTNLQGVSLFKRAIVLSEFRLSAPRVNLFRTGDNTFNFTDLLQRMKASEASGQKRPGTETDEPSRPLLFSISNIAISGGTIDFSDEPKQTLHRVEELTLALPFVSNFSYHTQTDVEPHFSAIINGTPFSFMGKTHPFHDSLETVLNIDINNLDLTHYLAYLPFDPPYRIDSGIADIQSEVAYAQAPGGVQTLMVSGAVALKNVKTSEHNGETLSEVPGAEIIIGRSDVFSKKLHLKRMTLTSPRVTAVRNSAGEINLAKLMIATEGKKLKREEPEQGFILTADEIRVSDGRIAFRDEAVDGPFSATVEKFEVTVSGFSNEKDKHSRLAVSFMTDAGEGVDLDGRFSVNPLSAQGTLSVKQLPLKRYAPYYRDLILFDIEEGALTARGRFDFFKRDDPEKSRLRLSDVSTLLTDVKLKKDGDDKEFFQAAVVSISGTSLDMSEKALVIGNFATEEGDIRMRRSADGLINLRTLFPRKSEDRPAGKIPEAPGAPSGGGWNVSLKRGKVAGYALDFEDRTTAPPAALLADDINLTLSDISTAPDGKGGISLALNIPKEGKLKAAGDIGINPVKADLKVDLKDLDIRTFEPYWRDRLTITVTGGTVSTSGKARFAATPGRRPEGSYSGNIEVSRFATVDNVNAGDFLRWRTLKVSGINLSLNPNRVDIDKVALSNFYSRIIIDDKGRANLQDVAAADESLPGDEEKPKAAEAPPEKASSKAPAGPDIDVRTVGLKGGKIHYTDRFIRPNVDADLTDLEGFVTGLTSNEAEQADVLIKGKVDGYAPLEINGKINPLGRNLYLDLMIKTTGVDLSPATPYAGKYMGYAIAKGKLSLDLKYHVAGRKIDAQNRVLLDQFTLGETVDSPEATDLPVALAVSLLKNRAGEIKLDLPVSGSLDDPEFKVGGVILQMVVNILEKVMTAPFALLGAIAGGGEELSYLEFEPGASSVDEKGAKKIGTLADVLHERPELKIELAGHADLNADRAALEESAFVRKLKMQKLNEMLARGETRVPLDEITIRPDEYPGISDQGIPGRKGFRAQARTAEKGKGRSKGTSRSRQTAGARGNEKGVDVRHPGDR